MSRRAGVEASDPSARDYAGTSLGGLHQGEEKDYENSRSIST
jgi:hypothetical protein